MMHRRSFLTRAGVGGLMAATATDLLAAPFAEPAATEEFAFTTFPALQTPTATGVTVAIGVNGPSTAWVEFGESEELGSHATAARHGLMPFDSLVHHIPLDHLRPGQQYYYRVRACPIDFRNAYDIRRGESIDTEIFRFRALDPQAARARFLVWNDTHENGETLAALMKLTAMMSSDVQVWNGDITNDNYQANRMVEHYIGAGGQPFACETPLLFVRGNHDARGPIARDLPRFVATAEGRFYYSFRHGPLAGIVLDGGEDKLDSHPVYAGLSAFDAYRREQSAWLEAELQKPHVRDARFRVAFCHIPFRWRGGGFAMDANDARSAWHRLLIEGKVAAVISGHTHRHAIFVPNEHQPYAQIVGGGPKLDSATLIHGEATCDALTITIRDLSGRDLAGWSVKA